MAAMYFRTGAVSQVVEYFGFGGLSLKIPFRNLDMRPTLWILLADTRAMAERVEFRVP